VKGHATKGDVSSTLKEGEAMDENKTHPADIAGDKMAEAKAKVVEEMHHLLRMTPYVCGAGPESLTLVDDLVSAAFAAGYEEGADAARRG
jgi:hypothetical protein